MIRKLFEAGPGRRPGAGWQQHYDAIGPAQHGGHPARLPGRHPAGPAVPATPRAAHSAARGFRPWLARLLQPAGAHARTRPCMPALPPATRAPARSGRSPRKGTGGRLADSGEGWLACSTRTSRPCARGGCLDQRRLGLRVGAPQQVDAGRGAWPRPAASSASVSASQPFFAWLPGWPSSTVRQVLSSSTPRLRPVDQRAATATAHRRQQFLEDVAQRWRQLDAVGARKRPGLRPGRGRGTGPGPGPPRAPRASGVSSSARSGCGG